MENQNNIGSTPNNLQNDNTNENIINPNNSTNNRSVPNNLPRNPQSPNSVISEENILFSLFPNLHSPFPQMPQDFEPNAPCGNFCAKSLPSNLLARKIYLLMLRAVNDYKQLSVLAPPEDVDEIENLKSQMQILSAAMLNIFQQLNSPNTIPFFERYSLQLRNDYPTALTQMEQRVYYIYRLTLKLLEQNLNSGIETSLLIIIANLKSQLNSINNLKN